MEPEYLKWIALAGILFVAGCAIWMRKILKDEAAPFDSGKSFKEMVEEEKERGE